MTDKGPDVPVPEWKIARLNVLFEANALDLAADEIAKLKPDELSARAPKIEAIIRNGAAWLRERAASEPRSPAAETIEMKLCESARLILRPGLLYRFTVDETCDGCMRLYREGCPRGPAAETERHEERASRLAAHALFQRGYLNPNWTSIQGDVAAIIQHAFEVEAAAPPKAKTWVAARDAHAMGCRCEKCEPPEARGTAPLRELEKAAVAEGNLASDPDMQTCVEGAASPADEKIKPTRRHRSDTTAHCDGCCGCCHHAREAEEARRRAEEVLAEQDPPYDKLAEGHSQLTAWLEAANERARRAEEERDRLREVCKYDQPRIALLNANAQVQALTEKVRDCEAEHPPEPWAAELEAKNQALTEERDRLRKAAVDARNVGTQLLNLNRIPTEAEYIHGYCEVDRIVRAALAPAEDGSHHPGCAEDGPCHPDCVR